jgi:CD109 antigen
LLWQDVDYGSGMTTLKTKVPETITSWILTGYSMSATSGLGLLQTPVVLTTFKPFFTDIRVPCACKMGDMVEVQVIVHNYMDRTSRVEVTLDDSAGDFDIIPTGRAFSDYETYDEDYELQNLKQNTVQVVGDGVRSTKFLVKLKKTGPVRLKVQTISSVACDTIEKSIIVGPTGKTITRTVTRPILLSPTQGSASSVFEINMPPNAVPGSMKVQITVQGDKYSLQLENQQPLTGGGDGDVVVALYAQFYNMFSPTASACQSSAASMGFMNAANNFLKSQCPDGGFRIDGDCDMLLRDTTYTVKILTGAAMSVLNNIASPDVVRKGYDWLASIQRADGSFPNPIPYPAIYVEGPITTSFVLFAFLSSDIYVPGIKSKHAATISKAMDSMFAQVDSLDILSLSFLCRSAQLNQDARRSIAFEKLSRLSFKNEYTQRWARSVLLDEALPTIFEIYQNEADIFAMFRVANGMNQYLVDNYAQIAVLARNNIFNSISFFNAYSSNLNFTSYQMKVAVSSSNSSTSGSSTSEMVTVVLDSSNQTLMSTFDCPPWILTQR